MVSASQIDEDNKKEVVIDKQNEEVDVYLFESDSIESDVLTTLDSKTTITLIEQTDQFSFIEVLNDEDNETITGYVLNDYIKHIEHEESNDDELTNKEEIDKAESTVEKENQEADEETNNANDNEQNSENMSLTTINNKTLNGIALKDKTHVYSEQSQSSEPLKSYAVGTSLKYFELNNKWYHARVKVDGTWTTGYIYKDDVENITGDIVSLEGIALKAKTNVYETTSTKANILRSYDEGSILKYKTLSSDWYLARVKYKGKWKSGYIHKSDVENITKERVAKEGIALRGQTNIYNKASKKAKTLKSYPEGSVLKYQTFSSDWYIARVRSNGKWQTGYIHKSDVDNTYDNQKSLKGVSLKQPTHIYTRASKKAGSHKTYKQGTVLTYKSLSNNWHEAIVYVKGVRKVGYIHKNDVEQVVDNQEEIEAWALKTPTNVYNRASRNAKVIVNNYEEGQMLKVKTLSKNWYEAKVRYKGVWTTGYIHAADISLVNATYNDYDLTLDEAVNIQLTGAPQTDQKQAWVSKHYIKDNQVTASELNVRLGPGTNFKAVDTIKEDTYVTILDEYNDWYVIEFDHDSQWTHASPKDVMKHLDPQNFINDEKQKFQFVDLSRTSGASVTMLNNYLEGKGTLAGQGQAFIDASNQLGVNDIYLISHALLETGHGQSNLAQGLQVGLDKDNQPQLVTSTNAKDLTKIKTVYNMFGIRAFDSCPESCGAAYAYTEGWDTPYKAIVGGARFISSDYIQGQNGEGTALNTLYKMRWNPEFAAQNGRFGKQYATDVGWAIKQVNTMYNLYEEIGEYKLVLDIPVYKSN